MRRILRTKLNHESDESLNSRKARQRTSAVQHRLSRGRESGLGQDRQNS